MIPESSAGAVVILLREAHVFTRRPDLSARLEPARTPLVLAPDELLHAQVPADYVVRLGKLRVTQFLPDGREVTRAVLQAGAAFATQPADRVAADARADRYPMADIVLASLGEAEVWSLPAGFLDRR